MPIPDLEPSPRRQRKREFPVCVHATFRDAHLEREYLRAHLFPAIQEACLLRDVEFREVELPIGDENGGEAYERYVERCLEEIMRQCPFVIGLVGGRYAWIEGAGGAGAAHLPWMSDRTADPGEIAEIGVMEGLLANPFMRERALFCFRSRDVEMARELTQDEESIRRIDLLTGRLEAGGFRTRGEYAALETLAEWGKEYLTSMLDWLYPEEAVSPAERERRLHDAIGERLRRGYVPIPDDVEQLDAHAASDGAPLVVHGPSGSGKSSLLAHWAHHHRTRHPDAFVITHFAGALASRDDHPGLLRRIMDEIRARYELDDEPPADSARIVSEFPDWLGRLGSERLILIVDAVDRLGGSGELEWLPDHVPPGVRLVLSTGDDRQLDLFRARGWNEMEVRPLSLDARGGIVSVLLGRAGARAHPGMMDFLAHDVTNANPLLLRLKILEIDLFLSERSGEDIEGLLRAADPEDLYAKVLGRLESELGREEIRRSMIALRITCEGLTIDQLAAVTSIPLDIVRTICAHISWYISAHDDRLSFNHESLASAVGKRYADQTIETEIRRRLILLCDDGSLHSILERLAQLRALEDMAGIHAMLLTPHVVRTLLAAGRGLEIVEAWEMIGRIETFDREYCDALLAAGSPVDHGEYAAVLADFLNDCSRHASAGRIAGYLIASDAVLDDELRIRCLRILGTIRRVEGDLEKAERYLEEAVELSRRLYGGDDHRTIAARQGLAELVYHLRGPKPAREMFQEIAHVIRAANGRLDAAYATAITNVGAALLKEGEHSSDVMARDLFKEALDIRTRLFGGTNMMTASSLNNLASALVGLREFSDALPHMELSRLVHARLYGERHYLTGRVTVNLAVLFKHLNDLPSAERYFTSGIEIMRASLRECHQDIAGSLGNYGSMLQSDHRYDEAAEQFCRAIRIRAHMFGSRHAETVNMVLNLAGNFRMRGEHRTSREDMAAARRLYEKAIPYRISEYGRSNQGTVRAIENYIRTLEALGTSDARGDAFRRFGPH